MPDVRSRVELFACPPCPQKQTLITPGRAASSLVIIAHGLCWPSQNKPSKFAEPSSSLDWGLREPNADVAALPNWGHSRQIWIVACDGLSANDPKRTSALNQPNLL